MAYGLGKSFVVKKDTAVLGYANESATYLDANHCEIGKYTTTAYPNYRSIRNAFALTLGEKQLSRRGMKSVKNSEGFWMGTLG